MRATQLVHAACSVVLGYPDEKLLNLLPSLRSVALPDRFGELLSYVETTPLGTLGQQYVETFDLHRKCCLYLTYYTHGDTRGRGTALLRFRRAYQAVGLRISDEELPDHLAVVLEFSAAGHTEEAVALLAEHRPGLELLRSALHGLGSPYAHAVAAVLATLPGGRDRRAVERLAQAGPPTELVGLS